jgi:arylsulfatase A-like enzyme|tara:strand:- start:2609 stop:4135 length:1527 start_codon:yes stop_codon:yes gene_type:complete
MKELLSVITLCISYTWGQAYHSPPNILFIMTDDHAAKAVSSYNDNLIHTPNIDRIGKEGARFTQAFATNSICAPSRATILTAKFSHLNGQKDNHAIFDGNQQTFPKLLQTSGYNTAMIGKWHLKSDPTGFDYWAIFPGQGYYYNPDINTMGDTTQIQGYATDLVTDLAIRWLQKKWDKSKPFFMFYSHKAPHRNWMPALRHLDKLQDRVFLEPSAFWDKYDTRLAADSQLMHLQNHFLTAYDSKITTVNVSKRDSALWKLAYDDRLTPSEKAAWDLAYKDERLEYIQGLQSGKSKQWLNYQRYMRDYLRCVMAVDENVGRMLEYLDNNGLTEHTVVVYISDQGMFLGEHGWFDKRWMYEESIRIPLVIRYPKSIDPGQVRHEMVMNVDFAPTLLDFAGVPTPEDMQGRSLKPLLIGETELDWREEMYYHYYEFPFMTHVNPHYGIRNSRYKLIRFYGEVEGWEFYDLQNDPTEQHNSYYKDEYREEITKMKERLKSLQKKYKDFNPEE